MSQAPTITRKSVQQLREERGLTREELAVAVKASYPTIFRIERTGSLPKVDLAERLYLFFGVPVGTIDWGGRPSKSVA